jgi:DNA-binding NarL/FixJ family response regulator
VSVPKVTVALADDHRVVRAGLRALLLAEPGLEVVGEAGDGREAVDLVERLAPDVLILDLMMPGLGGLEVLRQVTRRSPRTRVVVLSMHGDEGYVVQALGNGAAAYVLKGASATELLHAVRVVRTGRRYLSPPLSEAAVELYTARVRAGGADPYDRLTAREREVLHLTAEGLSSTAISERLGISSRTAETHRANAMSKLGLHNRADLVRYAMARGLLPVDGPMPSPRRR